ncbi:hypothetical protein ABZX39_33515 [Streptomyces collinus]|uniref:hypothetical protein n=1 Tax=Streptomyces collinus TaxID=42684 RepID=UPI0033A1794A
MGFASGLRKVIIDGWSYLNYKPIYSDPRGMPNRRAFPEAQASWVPALDERRLAAYKLLTAYDNNQAAELSAILDGESARERREFGDPAMFVDTVMAHVLGREQHITVAGAEHDTPEDPPAEAAAAALVQELLRDWADAELLPMRIQQAERKAVALGDGVYRMAWDPAKQRPTVRAVDPGFYFPILGEDADGGDFPDRVHFAWELPEDPKRGLKPRLRRITYELAPIGAATGAGADEKGRAVRAVLTTEGLDGEPVPVIGRGDTLDPETGQISRQYAWNDQPTTLTCYLTDATWDLGDLQSGHDVDDLPLNKAVFATRSDGEVLDRLDLYIDFIPVVHVPNTVPAAEEHWGQSSLAKVLQVFDELQGADTDSSRAAATTGLPMIGISGVTDPRQAYEVGPGSILRMGENGRLTTIDTSPALRELREHRHDLADRAANVARIPAVTLGTLDPSKVPSGYAMQLSLGPLDSLIGGMRLARAHKYMLLLKFAQRLFLAGQHPDWTGVLPLPAELVFGPYTPTDKASVLEQVTNGVDKGVLSLETGVQMLIEAGFPIDDAGKEIERIQSRQFDKARALADATGNPDAVAAFLGNDTTVTPATAPAPQLPPTATDQQPTDLQNPAGQGSGGNTP